MAHQLRIMQNGSVWHREVVSNDRDVIARGTAKTHAEARLDAEQAASRSTLITQSPAEYASSAASSSVV